MLRISSRDLRTASEDPWSKYAGLLAMLCSHVRRLVLVSKRQENVQNLGGAERAVRCRSSRERRSRTRRSCWKIEFPFSQGMRYKHQAKLFSKYFVVLKDRVSKSVGVWHVLSTSHVFTLSLEEYFYRNWFL